MKVWFIVIISVFHTILFAQEAEVKTQAQIYFEQGLHSTDLSKKIEFFQKALKINPVHQGALYRLGITYYRTGNFSKTVETLGKVYEIENEHKKTLRLYLRNAFTLLAKELIEQEEFDSAQNAARDALDIEPDYSPALTTLGTAQFYAGNYMEAIATLKKSVKIDSLQEDAWNRLGDIYLRIEAYPDAIFSYQNALSLNHDLQEAQFHLNIALSRCTPEFLLQKAQNAISENSLDYAVRLLNHGRVLFPGDVSIATKLKELENQKVYEESLGALDAEQWETARSLLITLPADFKNTSVLLDEVEAKLNPQESEPVAPVQVLIQVSPPEDETESNIDKKDASNLDQIPEGEVPIEVVAELIATEVETTQVIVKEDSMVVASLTPILAPPDSTTLGQQPAQPQHKSVVPKASQEDNSFNFWIGAIAGTFTMAFIAFLFIKNKTLLLQKKRNLVSRFTNLRSGGRTDDLMQVASDTPVKFGNIGTSDLFERTSENITHPDANLHLLETKTIVGGIKKLQRIGRYVIEKEIGRGSMGLVYKAWDPKLERTVVIKQVIFNKDKYFDIARLHDRLLREARAAGKLNHPNIVVIYDVEEDRNFSYIVMEYVEGYDLKSILEKQISLSPDRAIHIIKQICSALAFAHENGIIHRDIKPSNIILAKKDMAKVADFGIAKLPQLETLTQTDDIVGTPFYMSPEQIEGRKVDGRSDVFSTGVVLYEMITGNRPFYGDNIPSIVYKIVHKVPKAPSQKYDGIPKQFDEVIKKALAKDPSKRYQSAVELATALDSVLEEYDGK